MRLIEDLFTCIPIATLINRNTPLYRMKYFASLLYIVCPLFLFAQKAEFGVPGQNLFVNNIAAHQNRFPALNGAGITVSIKEFGFDTTDVDLTGRVLSSPNAAANLTSHANIVASLVGGAGISELRGRGAAPGCWLVSSSFEGLLPDPDYTNSNISVQNHSYGVDIQNWYGARAVAYDLSIEQNPSLLHVFSAGNAGNSFAASGAYANLPGFANLSGEFKMAKNVLLVGAVDSLKRIGSLSSRGPAYDGRIKPDLMAFGQDGSSGAAALISGAAAVLQQTLQEQSDSLPDSDLVRAVLINSADDLSRPGPDFESGFGNLNLKNAVQTIHSQHFTTLMISGGQTLAIPIQIPAKVRQLKITLVWNDPPAEALASKALIHDLDLQLIDPFGAKTLPWTLNTAANPDSLQLPAQRGIDTLNNIEQISLGYPLNGLWEIQVVAPIGMEEMQHFALAWSWDTLSHFEWTYPLVNDPCPAGEEVILRWETNLTETVARLEWRPTFSTEWRLIEDSVQLLSGWRRWIMPDTFTEAQLRMTIGGKVFNSDIFLIAKELRLKIGFNCPDSVMLFWNEAHPAAQYFLLGLGEKQMEPITIVTDTFIILKKSSFSQKRFAVAPITIAQDALGPRSSAPDISKQGVACYFSNFLAELNPDLEVNLNLSLGTIYGLSKVFFEKKVGDYFVVLNEQLVDKESFLFVDESPQNGANTYRTRLLLQNGAVLTGETATVYFAGKNGWWVFPNPVQNQGLLQVASFTEGEALFTLFDVLGKPVMEHKLVDRYQEIPMDYLPRGIYFFRIREGEVDRMGGKLVVE